MDLHQLTAGISNDFQAISSVGWLATQPDEFVLWLSRAGRWHSFDRNTVLYHADDDPDALYGLGSGALEITLPLVEAEEVTLYRAEPGYWIGDAAILIGTTRMVGVSAVAKSRVYRVPAAAIRAVLAERPEFWPCFYALAFLNAKLSLTLLAEVLSLTPTQRVARMLLRLGAQDSHVAVNQTDLARLIGMNRSTLQRALKSLMDSGAVTTAYRGIEITGRTTLERLAAEA